MSLGFIVLPIISKALVFHLLPRVTQPFCPVVLLVPLWSSCFPPPSSGEDANSGGRFLTVLLG